MIEIIAALTREYVIGRGNALPWHIPDDFNHFRRLTLGKTVLMGSRTYDSIGRPLPQRTNLVLSDVPREIPGVQVYPNLEEALREHPNVFVLGGASVYRQAVPIADRMHLSWIKYDYPGDVYFPRFSDEDWRILEREEHLEFEYCLYARR